MKETLLAYIAKVKKTVEEESAESASTGLLFAAVRTSAKEITTCAQVSSQAEAPLPARHPRCLEPSRGPRRWLHCVRTVAARTRRAKPS